MFRVIGQPNLNFTVDREKAARYQINVADVQDAIQTAVGGNALTQVLQGEQRYDLVLRYLPQYRDTKEAIENIRLLSPSGERVSLAQLCEVEMVDGARKSIAKAASATSPSSTACADAISAARSKRPSRRSTSRSSFPPATPSTGPASTTASSARSAG